MIRSKSSLSMAIVMAAALLAVIGTLAPQLASAAKVGDYVVFHIITDVPGWEADYERRMEVVSIHGGFYQIKNTYSRNAKLEDNILEFSEQEMEWGLPEAQKYMKNCSKEGGTPETISTRIGLLTTCKVIESDHLVLWYGDVLFGIAKRELVWTMQGDPKQYHEIHTVAKFKN